MAELRTSTQNHEIKTALLESIRESHQVFFGLVLAQAHRVSIIGDDLAITFTRDHIALAAQCRAKSVWLEHVIYNLSGRKMTVTIGLLQ